MKYLVIALLLTIVFVNATKPAQKAVQKQLAPSDAKSSSESSHTADVFLAYMDEEAAPMLGELMKLKQNGKHCKSLYIIERRNRAFKAYADALKESSLFQRALPTWPHASEQGFTIWYLKGDKDASMESQKGKWEKKRVLPHPVTVLKTSADHPIEKLMLKNIDTHYTTSEFVTELKANAVPGFGKMNVNFPELIMYRYGDHHAGHACVLIRAPEMGLQPQQARLHFKHLMKTFGGMSINFYAHGAGGAANKKDKPGCAHEEDASLWAGILRNGRKLIGEIKMFDLGHPKTKERTLEKTDEVTMDSDKPNDDANKAKGESLLKKIKNKWHMVIKKGTMQDNIKAAVQKAEETSKREVGFSSGFFQGLTDKQASEAVQSHGSNMEDSWVVATTMTLEENKGKNGFPELKKHLILRDDADPFEVTKAQKTAFNKWITENHKIKVADVVEIVMWGIKGFDTTKVPDQLCWTFPSAKTIEKTKFVQMGKKSGDKCPANPFFMEIATDFIEDGCGCIGMKDQKKIHSKCKEHQNKILEEIKKCDSHACLESDKVKTAVKAFVEVVKEFFGQKEETEMSVWVRDKWGSYLEPAGKMKSSKLADLALNEEGTDRCLYKASNFPLMKQVNEYLFNGKYTGLETVDYGGKFGFEYWAEKGKAAKLRTETCKLSG